MTGERYRLAKYDVHHGTYDRNVNGQLGKSEGILMTEVVAHIKVFHFWIAINHFVSDQMSPI